MVAALIMATKAYPAALATHDALNRLHMQAPQTTPRL